MDFECVAANPEATPDQVRVVALVLHVDKPAQHSTLVDHVAHTQVQHLAQVFLRCAQPVDGRDRCHHDHVPTGQQRSRGRVPQPVDLVVDAGVFLDVRVRSWHVCLGLVVVVVGDEILHTIVGEELTKLVRKLCRQRLVGSEHQRRTLRPLDRPRDRRALARAGDAQQRLEPVAADHAVRELGHGARLVTGRLETCADPERVGGRRRRKPRTGLPRPVLAGLAMSRGRRHRCHGARLESSARSCARCDGGRTLCDQRSGRSQRRRVSCRRRSYDICAYWLESQEAKMLPASSRCGYPAALTADPPIPDSFTT